MKIQALAVLLIITLSGCAFSAQENQKPQSKNYKLGFELGQDLRDKASRAYTARQACYEAGSGFLQSRFVGGLVRISPIHREVVRTSDGRRGCTDGAKGL